jgi:hypothetical protein
MGDRRRSEVKLVMDWLIRYKMLASVHWIYVAKECNHCCALANMVIKPPVRFGDILRTEII